VVIPLKGIEDINQEKGFRFGYSGLVVVVHGKDELFFEFNQVEARDDCAVTILRALDMTKVLPTEPDREIEYVTLKLETQTIGCPREASLDDVKATRRGSMDSGRKHKGILCSYKHSCHSD